MSLSYPSKGPSCKLCLVITRPEFQHSVNLKRLFFSTIYFFEEGDKRLASNGSL